MNQLTLNVAPMEPVVVDLLSAIRQKITPNMTR
jgi:hypothetical protein